MTVITEINRPSMEIISSFRALLENHDSVTCAVSDCLGRFNAMTADMKPLFEGIRLVGTAVTVRNLAGDLSASFKAVDLCQPGDVIVIDAHDSVNTAFWGENLTLSAMNKGVLAVVIDGSTRDVEEIRKLRFPVLSKGIVPNVGAVAGYGQVNVPIQCAGVPVEPGDIILVDANGVVVIPSREAADILAKTRQLLEKEHIIVEKLRQGATIGELVNIDQIFSQVFSYQNKATE